MGEVENFFISIYRLTSERGKQFGLIDRYVTVILYAFLNRECLMGSLTLWGRLTPPLTPFYLSVLFITSLVVPFFCYFWILSEPLARL